jgi:hypothetical protein
LVLTLHCVALMAAFDISGKLWVIKLSEENWVFNSCSFLNYLI